MLTLTFLKAFFSHWLGISFAVIVLILGGVAGFEHYENTHLTANIATLNQQLGAIKANDAQWQGAASDCSAGAAAVAASGAEVTAAAVQAVSEATVQTAPKVTFAKKILAQKYTGTDDYANAKTLMNQLIDQRQAELKGAK
jgi:hypothetical protein